MALVEGIYKATDSFPRREQYRLTDQLCRAAISIPSNIAEGSSRKSTKEFIRFINIAYGSVAEAETQLTISRRLGYIGDSEYSSLMNDASEIGKMLNALHVALRKKINNTASSELRTLNSEFQT